MAVRHTRLKLAVCQTLLVSKQLVSLKLIIPSTLRSYFGVHGLYNTIRFALALTIPCQLLQIPHAGFEGKKIGAYLVNGGYDALSLVIICVLVSII